MSEIAANKVGIFHYVLTDSSGEVLDSSEGMEPLAYLHGAGNIIPGLEAHMGGKKAGDSFSAVVTPDQAYGEINEEAFVQVPRSALPEGIQFQRGGQMIAEGEDGQPIPVWMDDYNEETDIFTFTFNHPLAGQTLTFNVQLVGVRDATEEELAQGHPHGIDGAPSQEQ